jgi:predicted Abi (CAAX) family protease
MRKNLRLVLCWLITIGLVWTIGFSLSRPMVQAKVSAGMLQASSNTPINAPVSDAPIEPWQGRLELPSIAEIVAESNKDWAWIEVDRAPRPEFIGKRLKVTRQPAPVSQATTAVNFSSTARASSAQGNIHPQRLDGRSRVSSLQSLAGARAQNDVWVRLETVTIGSDGSLGIDREPIQTTGHQRLLVQLGHPSPDRPDLFPSRPYNPITQKFDGESRIVQIPQIPATKHGLYPSSIQDLSSSSAGQEGWYLYGQQQSQGPFLVESLAPRSLFELRANQQVQDLSSYLDQQNWAALDQRHGQISKVANSDQVPTIGQRALLIHNFGEISGQGGDTPSIPLTATGHFAYGIATVVLEEITQQPRWDLVYNQVYAHNPDGIIAGKQDWATYMGHLQRGWMGTRPVVDALISYPPVTTDYDFDGIAFSPLTTFQQQLELSAARYRVGDGTGSASVTPATSCVQDANQALYLTIDQLTRQANPQIQRWLLTHPQDPQTQRFQELQALGQDLRSQLAPLGIVRSDWLENAQKLSGTSPLTNSSHPMLALLTWRTMLPRGAQDGMIKIFDRHGAHIQLLQTVQIGGVNPFIGPVAPTVLFGRWPWLSTGTIRLWAGVTTLPNNLGSVLGLLVSYGAIAVIFGIITGFIGWQRQAWTLGDLRLLLRLFLAPALVEELLFRCLLLPHPIEGASLGNTAIAIFLSTLLFIIYHPANALTFYRPGRPTFWDWRFLSLAGLLGLTCAICYQLSGSLWPPVIIHWLAVSIWIIGGGGRARLS